jgi:hypothetical protein
MFRRLYERRVHGCAGNLARRLEAQSRLAWRPRDIAYSAAAAIDEWPIKDFDGARYSRVSTAAVASVDTALGVGPADASWLCEPLLDGFSSEE